MALAAASKDVAAVLPLSAKVHLDRMLGAISSLEAQLEAQRILSDALDLLAPFAVRVDFDVDALGTKGFDVGMYPGWNEFDVVSVFGWCGVGTGGLSGRQGQPRGGGELCSLRASPTRSPGHFPWPVPWGCGTPGPAARSV